MDLVHFAIEEKRTHRKNIGDVEERVVLGALRQALATPCHDEGWHVDAALPTLPAPSHSQASALKAFLFCPFGWV